MIKNYLLERGSWILLYIVSQLLMLLIAAIDPALSITSVIYIVFLSTIMLILFTIIRYQKETPFYKSVQNWSGDDDITDINRPTSPFEHIVAERLNEQTTTYKQAITRHKTELEQEKDELLSWIHEVKTPLSAMHLMIDRVDDKKMKQQLQYEWLRINLLLDQQLHQKRIPFIENDLYIEHTKLDTVISQEIKALRSWCMRRGVGFDLSLQTEEVLTDAKWLAFIIRQLLTNAIKYTENDDIVITSYVENKQTILTIHDHGRGIDAKDIPRIFNRGFTSTISHHDTAASGMGLYLVNKAASPLHIKITVQSEVGEGTKFILTFPEKNDFVAISGM